MKSNCKCPSLKNYGKSQSHGEIKNPTKQYKQVNAYSLP